MAFTLKAFLDKHPTPAGYGTINVLPKGVEPDSPQHLTQARLAALLEYDPESGEFTWRSRRGSALPRSVAGKLRKDGYTVIGIDGRSYAAHRLAFLYMTGRFPQRMVDHIDLNRSNNAWRNLREVTNSENQMNTAIRSNNSSGRKGVSWNKREGRWRADIRIGGKKKTLGYFECPDMAHMAYCTAANENFGDYARAN